MYACVCVCVCVAVSYTCLNLHIHFRLTRPSSLDAVPTSSLDDPQTTRSLTSGSISGQVTEPPVSSQTMPSSDTTSQQCPTASDEAQDNKGNFICHIITLSDQSDVKYL